MSCTVFPLHPLAFDVEYKHDCAPLGYAEKSFWKAAIAGLESRRIEETMEPTAPGLRSNFIVGVLAATVIRWWGMFKRSGRRGIKRRAQIS
jgi:hypothetical protein